MVRVCQKYGPGSIRLSICPCRDPSTRNADILNIFVGQNRIQADGWFMSARKASVRNCIVKFHSIDEPPVKAPAEPNIEPAANTTALLR